MTTPSTDIIERLRDGCVEHKRRWSGDTHADLGGSIDAEATDALMDEAANEIVNLIHERDSYRRQATSGGRSDEVVRHREMMEHLLQEIDHLQSMIEYRQEGYDD